MDDDMNLGRMLADQLQRIFQGLDGPAWLLAEETGTAPALAAEVAVLALDDALIPEARGGGGLGWRDIGPAFLALGHYAAPVPLGETLLARRMLDRLDRAADGTLADIGLGRVTGTDRVSGTVDVPWARDGALLLVTLADGGVGLVDPAGAKASPRCTLGRDPGRRVSLTEAPLLARAAPAATSLQDEIALLRAAQMAGALSRCLELSLEYGNTRVQFGRPIGKFQAVQHLISELAGEAAAARAAVGLALTALDQGAGAEAIAVAKIRTGAAVRKACFSAHETHGAIGVTEEHILHYFTRRLMQWREEAGNEHAWGEWLGQRVLAEGGAGLWPQVVGLSGG